MRVTVNKNQKAAWNATMREEVGIVSKQAALEEAKQKGRLITTRSSNRTSTTTSTTTGKGRQNVHGGVSEVYFKRLARLERLELTNAWDALEKGGGGGGRSSKSDDDDDDGEYQSVGGGEEEEDEDGEDYDDNEEDDDDEEEGGGKRRRAVSPIPASSSSPLPPQAQGEQEQDVYKPPPAKRQKRLPVAAAAAVKRRTPLAAAAAASTRLFLHDILLKDAGSSHDFVNAMARRPVGKRKEALVCDVTGRPAKYVDPITGLRVADRRAMATLREQVPGWLKATAISPYWDAVQAVQRDNH